MPAELIVQLATLQEPKQLDSILASHLKLCNLVSFRNLSLPHSVIAQHHEFVTKVIALSKDQRKAYLKLVEQESQAQQTLFDYELESNNCKLALGLQESKKILKLDKVLTLDQEILVTIDNQKTKLVSLDSTVVEQFKLLQNSLQNTLQDNQAIDSSFLANLKQQSQLTVSINIDLHLTDLYPTGSYSIASQSALQEFVDGLIKLFNVLNNNYLTQQLNNLQNLTLSFSNNSKLNLVKGQEFEQFSYQDEYGLNLILNKVYLINRSKLTSYLDINSAQLDFSQLERSFKQEFSDLYALVNANSFKQALLTSIHNNKHCKKLLTSFNIATCDDLDRLNDLEQVNKLVSYRLYIDTNLLDLLLFIALNQLELIFKESYYKNLKQLHNKSLQNKPSNLDNDLPNLNNKDNYYLATLTKSNINNLLINLLAIKGMLALLGVDQLQQDNCSSQLLIVDTLPLVKSLQPIASALISYELYKYNKRAFNYQLQALHQKSSLFTASSCLELIVTNTMTI